MSDNIIFTATSNLLGHNKIEVQAIDAPNTIVEGTFMVSVTGADSGVTKSLVLSSNEIRALRDSLTQALADAEIEDIMRLLD